MPAPYPRAKVYNREFQWIGGNPLQSALSGMAVASNGDIFWGAGSTLVGGLNITRMLKSNVYTRNKIAELNSGATNYLGGCANTDPNGKLWFNVGIVQGKLVRYSAAGVYEGQNPNLVPLGYALDTTGNNFAWWQGANQGYIGIRRIATSGHVIYVWNYNTFAHGLYNPAVAPVQSASMTWDAGTSKPLGSQNVNQIQRYLNTPAADININTAPDAGTWIDFIMLAGFCWACSPSAGKIKKVNVAAGTIAATLTVAGARLLTTDGSFLFAYRNAGILDIIHPVSHTVEQSISGLITNAIQMKYHTTSKTLVLSNSGNPGTDNVSFLLLNPVKGRHREDIDLM